MTSDHRPTPTRWTGGTSRRGTAYAVEPPFDVRDQTEALPRRERLTPAPRAPRTCCSCCSTTWASAPRRHSADRARCRSPSGWPTDGLRYTPLPHHGTLLADPGGADDRPQPPCGRHGHGRRDLRPPPPGYDAHCRPTQRAAPSRRRCAYNGYATGAFGKWHQTPRGSRPRPGPFDRWPTRRGLRHASTASSGGEANQFEPDPGRRHDVRRPAAHRGGGLPPVRGPRRPGASTGSTTSARRAGQAVVLPTSPFGATHAPFHVPRELGREVPRRVRARLGPRSAS